MRRLVLATLLMSFGLVSCVTKPMGRLPVLSVAEMQSLTCPQIATEIGQAEEFMSNVRAERGNVDAAALAAWAGDLGNRNATELAAAEISGFNRLTALKDLRASRGC